MQKRQRFVADQRFDLPQYNSMIGFISQEFRNYYKEFVTANNYIVKNWKVEDAGGLNVRVNNGNESLLFNTERPDFELLNYRDAGATLLTHVLDDNSVNYVEIEINTTTTGEDSVAIWDQAANGGEGEEFIQNVDTAFCEEPSLVSNTIAFSVGQPNRIPLAIVTTSGGVITNIQDARLFLYHLDSDWDFDGTAFGSVRTDKTIASIKQMFDAFATSLKEFKDTPNWFDDPGISPIDILERLNYMLVDGGTISWNLPKAATGWLIAHKADPSEGVADDDTFTIDDGNGNVATFTFDTDASGPANPVTLASPNEDEATVQAAIVAAINAHPTLEVTATPGDGFRIELVNDNIGTLGNVAIVESISNNASLFPFGMEGGFDDNELTWTQALRIIAPSRAFEYTIDPQTVSDIADGEVVFVTLPTEGVAPGGSLAVSKIASADYDIDFANTRNYIIAYRSGTKIYFGNGWHGVELEDGESNQLGDGITSQWITATGLVDEFDSTPPYWSTHWITPGASFTDALSTHDQVIEDIWNMVIGIPYDERVKLLVDTPTGSFVTLPPPFGLGANQTYQTGIRQLEVFFNGRKAKVGIDYAENANIGSGIGDRIELLNDYPAEMDIDFRIQIGGGQDSVVSSAAADIELEGSLVEAQVGRVNFRDAVEVNSLGPNEVEVRVGRSLVHDDALGWGPATLTVTYDANALFGISDATRLIWQFKDAGAFYEIKGAKITHPTATDVKVEFQLPPGASTYRLVGVGR